MVKLLPDKNHSAGFIWNLVKSTERLCFINLNMYRKTGFSIHVTIDMHRNPAFSKYLYVIKEGDMPYKTTLRTSFCLLCLIFLHTNVE